MKLSAPIYHLRRRARLLAREQKIPLHQALDRIARMEGFASWSLLAGQFATTSSLNKTSPTGMMLSRLDAGDLLLLGARPGHGKTLLGLQLLLDAAAAGRKAVFFTLEYTEDQVLQRIRLLAGDMPTRIPEIVTSNDISASYIMRHLNGAPRGTLAMIDYLQILDQQRSKPALADQMRMLRGFAHDTGIVLGFISQIDRAFDPARKPIPEIGDIRLPNKIEPAIFSKTCFLHDGAIRFQALA